jgi:hypothetical protein
VLYDVRDSHGLLVATCEVDRVAAYREAFPDCTVAPTRQAALRWPRLVQALRRHSAGYFSRARAAEALTAHAAGQPYRCEWYVTFAGEDPERLRRFGRTQLRQAIHARHQPDPALRAVHL